jgi:hypothetical protein
VRGLKLVHSSGHKRKAGIPARELQRPALLISLWHRPKPCSPAGAAQQGCSGLARQPASSFMVLTVHSFPLPSYSYSFIPRLYEYCIFLSYQHSECSAFKTHQSPPPTWISPLLLRCNVSTKRNFLYWKRFRLELNICRNREIIRCRANKSTRHKCFYAPTEINILIYSLTETNYTLRLLWFRLAKGNIQILKEGKDVARTVARNTKILSQHK